MLGLVACAPALPPAGSLPASGYVAVEGEDGELELLDDESLFQRASELYDRGFYLRALRRHRMLLAELPDSPLVPLSLYDAGLCLMALQEHEEAIDHFARYLATGPGAREAREARFQIARAQGALRRWSEVVDSYQALLAEPLEAAERLLAGAQLGWALLELGREEEAEPRFRAALHLQRHDEQLKALRGAGPAAMAAFGLGEIEGRRARRVPLRLPVAQMARDLDEKGRRFLRAQDHYVDALRYQDRQWSVAAGHQLGALYESFRADLVAAERPDQIASPALHTEYMKALQEHLRPLVEKARLAYEMTLEMSARMGAQDSDWARRARRSLGRLRETAD